MPSYPSGPQVDPPPPPMTPTPTPPGHAPVRHASPSDPAPASPAPPPQVHSPLDREEKGKCAQCCVDLHCDDKPPWDLTHPDPDVLAFIATQGLTCPEATMVASTFTNTGANPTKRCPETPYDAANDIADCRDYCNCLWIWNVDPAAIPHCGPYISAVVFGCFLADGDGNPFPATLDPPCPHAVKPKGVFYGEIDVKRAVHLREQPPPCPDITNGGTHHYKPVQQADCTWLCVEDDGTPQTCPPGTYSLHGNGLPPCCRTTCTPAVEGNCDICHTPPGDCSGPDRPECFDIFGDAPNPSDCANYCPNSPTTQERRSHYFLTGCPDIIVGGVNTGPAPWIKGCNPLGPMHHYSGTTPSIDVTDYWGNFYVHLVNACSPGDHLDVFCPIVGGQMRKPCGHKSVRAGCESCLQWDANPAYREVVHQLVTKGWGVVKLSTVEQAPKDGPGTELERIIDRLMLKGWKGCRCNELRDWMNRLGVEGCRTHRGALEIRLRDKAKNTKWWPWVRAAAIAVVTGIAFKVKWRDPAPGMLDLAINRAERKQKKAEKKRKKAERAD